MNFNNAYFENSFGNATQLPLSDLPEICFSGKSNVGKSSLINKTLGRKSLARVSSTPGKTVTVNFYRLDTIRLVDLPGYGFAKRTDAEKERFSALTESYFGSGRNIKLCLQLIDMRHTVNADDMQMLSFLNYYKIPFAVILTKCDKLNKSEFEKRLSDFKAETGDLTDGAEIIPFSSLKGIGVEKVREIIEKSIF